MNWVTEGLSLIDVSGGGAAVWLTVLADVMIKGTVILGVAAAVTLGLRGASAAVRHKVWGVAMGSLLLLPILSVVLPEWNVSFLPAIGVLETSVEPPNAEVPAVPQPTIVVVGDAPVTVVVPREVEPTIIKVPATPTFIAEPTVVPVAEPPVQAAASGSRRALGAAAMNTLQRPGAILTIWAIGATLVIGVLGAGLLRVWTLARQARPVTDQDLLGLSEAIAHDWGIDRPIRLLESRASVTPMTWGFRNPVVMMPRAASSWSLVRRRDVLLHELAHVKRNDYATQLLSRYACAVYWFSPFVWLAAKQLRLERERACDDAVLNAGSRPTDYANHLLQIARSLKAAHSAAFATVAMARPSQLSGRLLDVLDESRSRRAVSGSASAMTWLGAAALVLPLAGMHPGTALDEVPSAALVIDEVAVPSVSAVASVESASSTTTVSPSEMRSLAILPQAQGCVTRSDSENRGTNSNSNNDRHTIRWWDGDCEGEVRIRGDVEFTEDFSDIARLARGGSFEIELDDGETIRAVEIAAGRNGQLERRWFVNRREAEYTDEAARWLDDALLEFFRRSSYMLEERAEWLLETRGVDGLLEEARLSYSSYVRAKYYGAAIASELLSVAQVQQVMTQAQRDVDSDYEMSGLLRSVPARYLQDDGVRATYIQASNSLESDYERGRVLRAMLLQEDLSDELVINLLRSAQNLNSDYELAKLLIEIAPRYLHNNQLRSVYITSTAGLESDYEHTRVLLALFEQPNLTNQILGQLLASAVQIDSDYELSKLLQRTARNYVVDETLRVAFFDAVGSVDSDYEHKKILLALMENRQLAPLVVVDVLESAVEIESDYELSNILRQTAGTYVLSETLRPLFFRAVRTLDSDYERRRVLVAVADRSDVSAAVIMDVIAVTEGIDSDHEKGTILMTLGERYRTNDQLLEALMDAADTLDSDYEHGRVMRVLRGRRRGN